MDEKTYDNQIVVCEETGDSALAVSPEQVDGSVGVLGAGSASGKSGPEISDSSGKQRVDDTLVDYQINFQYHKLIRHDFVVKGNRGESTWVPYIDSGAQRSTMSKATAELLGLNIIRDVNFRVICFDQKPSKLVYGYAENVELYVPGTNKTIKFSPIIMDSSEANLAGLDVILPCGGGEVATSDDLSVCV